MSYDYDEEESYSLMREAAKWHDAVEGTDDEDGFAAYLDEFWEEDNELGLDFGARRRKWRRRRRRRRGRKRRGRGRGRGRGRMRARRRGRGRGRGRSKGRGKRRGRKGGGRRRASRRGDGPAPQEDAPQDASSQEASAELETLDQGTSPEDGTFTDTSASAWEEGESSKEQDDSESYYTEEEAAAVVWSGPRPWSPPARMKRSRLRIQARQGSRAAVRELRPGLFLVSEVPSAAVAEGSPIAANLGELMDEAAANALEGIPPEMGGGLTKLLFPRGGERLLNRAAKAATRRRQQEQQQSVRREKQERRQVTRQERRAQRKSARQQRRAERRAKREARGGDGLRKLLYPEGGERVRARKARRQERQASRRERRAGRRRGGKRRQRRQRRGGGDGLRKLLLPRGGARIRERKERRARRRAERRASRQRPRAERRSMRRQERAERHAVPTDRYPRRGRRLMIPAPGASFHADTLLPDPYLGWATEDELYQALEE